MAFKVGKLVTVDSIEGYMFLIGGNYTSNKFPYPVIEKLTSGEYSLWQVDNPNDWDKKNQYEIIAHGPVNNYPILMGDFFNELPILPPISCSNFWDIKKHYLEYMKNEYNPIEGVSVTIQEKCAITGYIAGYTKAKEQFKYTENDLEKIISFVLGKEKITNEELIRSINNLPIAINYIIKNSSEGKKVLIGKYIY